MGIIKVSDLAIGDAITGGVFNLKAMRKAASGYTAVLADRDSEIPAVLSEERYEKGMNDLIGGAVAVNGVVLNGTDMTPYVKIKSLLRAEQGTYKSSDLFTGLDEAHIKGYRDVISSTIAQIPDETCRSLCAEALNDDTLLLLSIMPASVGFHGRYAGGALATTATVAKMAVQAGVQYQKWSHGLYGDPVINWSVLITAALLHTLAIPEYYKADRPWNRTDAGIYRGYYSLLQSKIENVIRSKDIPLDTVTLSKILNVLGCAVNMKTSVKATSPEGILFRHVLIAYEDLDMLAEDTATHETEDGETGFYSSRSHRYMVIGNADDVPVEERKGA